MILVREATVAMGNLTGKIIFKSADNEEFRKVPNAVMEIFHHVSSVEILTLEESADFYDKYIKIISNERSNYYDTETQKFYQCNTGVWIFADLVDSHAKLNIKALHCALSTLFDIPSQRSREVPYYRYTVSELRRLGRSIRSDQEPIYFYTTNCEPANPPPQNGWNCYTEWTDDMADACPLTYSLLADIVVS